MLADHPFLPKTSRLVLADYVTMDSGTGCVHTAPGFGADDYQTCRRYGMDMVVPVNDQGRHTDYAGKYAGMLVEESNPVILKDMQESGALFASEQIVHSYPHCWRCKKPIIFRATPQWFCSVESFKDAACAACDDVRWLPAWGIDRMKAMIRERADWCISRQRRWGLPIPVFYCKDCGKPICTDETIAKISKLFGEFGSNVWFEKDADELVPEGFACPHCGGRHFEKETDTLDGWFDSGSTHFASMQKDQGFTAHEVESVIGSEPAILADVPKRLKAVHDFMSLPEAESLAAANKRIENILKKNTLPLADAVDPALLTEKEEKDLYEAIRTLEPKLEADYKAGRYEDELRSLAPLKAPVDAFFDKVMVNAEDEALRRNRLTLLNELHKAMNQVAKLSCLAS